MGPLDRKVEWVFLVQSAYNSSRVILFISLSSFKQRQTRLKRVAFAGLSYPRILIAGTLSIQKKQQQQNQNKTKQKKQQKNTNLSGSSADLSESPHAKEILFVMFLLRIDHQSKIRTG